MAVQNDSNNQIGTISNCNYFFKLVCSQSAVSTGVTANCQSPRLHRCENLTAVQ